MENGWERGRGELMMYTKSAKWAGKSATGWTVGHLLLKLLGLMRRAD
jgi:hypothetical protein